ncbi:MAG: hypothetical protein P1U40_01955 [Coxiellaceae bacterium]|nr:hypothetical protein [Coxiellaceae bacterium]
MSRLFADFGEYDPAEALLSAEPKGDTPPTRALSTAKQLAAAGIDSYTFVNITFFLQQELNTVIGKDDTFIRKYPKENLLQHIVHSIRTLFKAPPGIDKENACELTALKFLQVNKLLEMDNNNVRAESATAHSKPGRGYLPAAFKLGLYNRLLGIMDSQLSAISVHESRAIRATLDTIYDPANEQLSYTPPPTL